MPQNPEPADEKPRLRVEMIPGPVMVENLRRHLKRGQWKTCQRYARGQSGGDCAVCGGVGPDYPVECHERWEYLEDCEPRVLRLAGLIALCPACHRVVHLGRTDTLGAGPAREAREHLAEVNRWSRAQVEEHVAEARTRWRERSRRSWAVDLSWVTTTLGLELDQPSDPEHRFSSANRRDELSDENPFDVGTQEYDEHEMYLERLAGRND